MTRGPGVTRGPSRSPVTGSTPRGAGVLDPGRSTSTSSRSIFSCCGAVFEGGWLSAALWDGCFQGWGGLKKIFLYQDLSHRFLKKKIIDFSKNKICLKKEYFTGKIVYLLIKCPSLLLIITYRVHPLKMDITEVFKLR